MALVLISVTTLFACSSAEKDWGKADAANSISAYQEYLGKHPTGEHSAEASDRIHSLQDEAAWSQAKQSNTGDAYRDYFQKEPTGAHTKDAQDALTAEQRTADWKSAASAGTAATLQDFLKKYPQGAEADQARTKLADLTGYRVRLASAKSEKQAQRERDHLHSKYAQILDDVVVVPTDSGNNYGVESGPMSQSQADTACGQLKKARQTCDVVKNDMGRS
jgi:hypothetical protein